MKLIRVLLSWLVPPVIIAAAFVGWRTIFGILIHLMLANARWRAALQGAWPPSAPELAYFPDFLYRAGLLALFCIAGRLVFRLRLTPLPRGTKFSETP